MSLLPIHDLVAPDELVIGFVAAVGVDLEIPKNAARTKLEKLGYKVIDIRVTQEVFPNLSHGAVEEKPLDYFERTKRLMDIGDDARKKQYLNKSKRLDIIAPGIAATIKSKRESVLSGEASQKIAFLVHSLKHPHEVLTLREIYPRGFYLVGVHAPASTRKRFLMEDRDLSGTEAIQLMDRDKQSKEDWGQKLVDTFHRADFFTGWPNVSNEQEYEKFKVLIQNDIDRFIEIVFGHPNRTPTFGEYAMFLAFSSALRSADLSRQVGAVITRGREVLSAGANDCPSPGGGLYWPDFNSETLKFEDFPKGRDYARGKDSNRDELVKLKDNILKTAREAFTSIFDESTDLQISDPGKLSNLLERKLSRVLEDSPIGDLTEFGRVVHAEMEALLSCARKGISTSGSSLYSTTFPCHNCAKHIIASGVRRVVFIEPYLKSKALDMFEDDAIEISYPMPFDWEEEIGRKVQFQPFVGVGPRRFMDLFSMDIGTGRSLKRKDGPVRARVWSEENAELRISVKPDSYLDRENVAQIAFSRHVSR